MRANIVPCSFRIPTTPSKGCQVLRDFLVFPEAAWNVPLRMALYERAFVNLGVNNGPMGLAWLNARACYATLKIETANVPQSSLGFIRSFGFEPGKSLQIGRAHV